MTTTSTRRPLRWSDESDAMVPMTDAELAEAGWVQLPNRTYVKES